MPQSSTHRPARHRFAPALLIALSTTCVFVAAANAAAGDITFDSSKAGVTPFISHAKFNGDMSNVTSVAFMIAKQPGALAQEVNVKYKMSALKARGDAPSAGPLTLPIFGLYDGVTNPVTVTFTMKDGSSQVLNLSIKTKKFKDQSHIYDQPTIVTPLAATSKVGWNYMYLKSAITSPVVIDVDSKIRWVGTAVPSSFSSIFNDSKFYIGEHDIGGVTVMDIDGSTSHVLVDDPEVQFFNHNIVPGRDAMLAGVDTVVDGVYYKQSTIIEMTETGHVIRKWDFAKIISDYMAANGDDPTQFVRPQINWMHSNNSMYDPADNSLTVSSREQFVMKVDYDTGEIKWILGDPTKWWHTFPSLRAKQIKLEKGDFYPIGQHGINKAPDGSYLLFNNGSASYGLPKDEPAGKTRAFSTASAYKIDPVTMTGHEVLRYTHDKTFKANVCGSAFQQADKSMLIDFASTDDDTTAHLVGLDGAGNIAYEFMYATSSCATSWNTIPIAFEALEIKN